MIDHPRHKVRQWVVEQIKAANTDAEDRVFENRKLPFDPYESPERCPAIQVYSTIPGYKEKIDRASTLHRRREFIVLVLIVCADQDLEDGSVLDYETQIEAIEMQVDRLFRDFRHLDEGLEEFELYEVWDPQSEETQTDNVGAYGLAYRVVYNQSLRDPAEGLPDQDGVDFQFGGSAPQ